MLLRIAVVSNLYGLCYSDDLELLGILGGVITIDIPSITGT